MTTSEEAQKEGLVGFMWSLQGRHIHACGFRYRKATQSEIARGKCVNWATPETIEMDAEAFKRSKGQ